ncbi:hypothetical protein F5888DRAFT_1826472 [Russula emetica]|nr:hypothetical protein F5888DRAFT_1826472 [Russula emetica]
MAGVMEVLDGRGLSSLQEHGEGFEANTRRAVNGLMEPSQSRCRHPDPQRPPSSSTCTTPIRVQLTSTPATKSSAPRKILASSSTVGVKRKPTPLPVTAPHPKRGMTPLCVTRAAGDGSSCCLAPLPAPKLRGERSNGEVDGLLRTELVTLARLRIDKEESDAISGDEEEAVDISLGGHITKRLAHSRLVSQELIDSTAATTGSHSLFHAHTATKAKRKSTTSSIACPTTRSRTSSRSSSSMASSKTRQRILHSSNVSVSSRSKREDAKSLVHTRKPSISQLHLHIRVSATPARPRPATVIAFESPINASGSPAHLRLQLDFGRPPAASRHSYAGLDSPFLHISGESSIGSNLALPAAPSSPTSEFVPLPPLARGRNGRNI